MAFNYTRESDQQDFAAVLKQRGRAAEEFDISDAPNRLANPGQGISAVVGTVRIKSMSTGAERIYSTGGIIVSHSPFVAWVEEFAGDLDAGFFG